MGIKATIRVEDTYIPDAIINVVYNLRRNHQRGFRIEYQVQVMKERPCSADDRTLMGEYIKKPENAKALNKWRAAQEKADGIMPDPKLWFILPDVESAFKSWLAVRKQEPEQYWVDVRDLRGGFDLEQHPGNTLKAVYEYVMALPELENAQVWPKDDA